MVFQVENMMVGGLSVIGIFAVAPPDVLKNMQHKLRQVCIEFCKGFVLEIHKTIGVYSEPF